MKKTHILKLLVTKANPFYASEETVLATNPIDVLEKEKKWFHMSGNTTFLISLANFLCLFFNTDSSLEFFKDPQTASLLHSRFLSRALRDDTKNGCVAD